MPMRKSRYTEAQIQDEQSSVSRPRYCCEEAVTKKFQNVFRSLWLCDMSQHERHLQVWSPWRVDLRLGEVPRIFQKGGQFRGHQDRPRRVFRTLSVMRPAWRFRGLSNPNPTQLI
jgi:hypothetical protein